VGKINRFTIDIKVENKLKKHLWKALSFSNSPTVAQEFWEKFLTPSEVVILAKRLEVFKKVIEKKPYQSIKDELKVGSTTIARAQNTVRKHGSSFKKRILKSAL